MENLRNSSNKTGRKKGNFSKFAPILAGALFLMNPNGASAQNLSNQSRDKTEISASTMLDRLNQKIGVSLPDEYNQKVLDFVLNDTTMRTRSATAYTEEFIANEMKKDRGISKQNQLLFIRSSIYGGISKNFLYDRLDDDNEIRSDEYEKALDEINKSYEEYKKGFKTYMEMKSAEADKRSAEADKRSAEADKRSAEADKRSSEARQQSAEATYSGLNNLIKFYNFYKEDPNNVKKEDIKEFKEHSKRIIQNCKKFGIDYKAKLSPEVRKFYGID